MPKSIEHELTVIFELRAHLDRLEKELLGKTPAIQPGDLAQIRPEADDVFGGLIIRVTRVLPARVDGYILRPHRCGSRLGWLHYTAPELTRIGRLEHPEAAWGFQGL